MNKIQQFLFEMYFYLVPISLGDFKNTSHNKRANALKLLPQKSLYLKGFGVMLVQLFFIMLMTFFLFKNAGEGLILFIVLLLSIPVEILAGAGLLIWYHRGIREQHPFSIAGVVVPTIPLRAAAKITWACTWRLWFIKFLVMGIIAITLIVISKFISLNAMGIIDSESFSRTMMKFDIVMTILAFSIFLPHIHNIYPAYRFKR